jgi:hypothetical protein
MSSSPIDRPPPLAQGVRLAGDALIVELDDGRTLTVPLEWYPRLAHATASERERWQLIGSGEGIHWPDLDEDLGIEGLLAGRRSAESQDSFNRWLMLRRA